STILGAAKLTGRLPSGRSIGVLTAVTNEAFARVADLGSPDIDRVRVGALTSYGLARVQQDIGSNGSMVSVLVGGVHRNLEEDDPLANLLSRNALVVGGD